MQENAKNSGSRLIIAAAIVAALAAVAFFAFQDENDEQPVPQNVSQEAETELPENIKKVPAFDLVRISRGGTGVIAGRMAPGAQVELYANGKKVSEVTADENGEWVMILEEPLQTGSVELNLKSKAVDADEVAEADNVVVVSVPERDNKRFLERQQNGVVAVLTPKNGEGASTVLQKPGVAAFAEVGESLSVDTIDYGEGGKPVFSGRSLPRVQVRLYLDDVFVGSAKADDQGRWQIIREEGQLTSGEHMLRADQTVSEGQVVLRVEQPFTTGEPIDPGAAEGGVVIRPGNTLWQIARQLYGAGVRYTLIFKENSEQIRDPDLIYPGQIFRLPEKKEN